MKIFQANSFNFAFAMLFLENVCFSKSEEGHNECRNVIYKPEIHNKALIGHVIADESDKTKDDCQTLCYLDPNCVSINYNQQPGVAKNCELNSKSEEGHHLTEKPGTVYQAMVNNCNESSCAANKTCQSGFGPNGYRCVCPKCFYGDHCEKDTNDTILSFTEQSIENTVIWENQNTSLIAFTISMWVQIDQDTWADKSTPTLLSYATKSEDNDIWLLFDANHKLEVGINNDKNIKTDIHINDRKWHHICFSWENTNGSINVYLDGKKAHPDSSLQKGHTILPGAIVIGQEQDSYKRKFDKQQSFKGNLTSVNIWNEVLSANEIAHLANNCPSGEGNFVKWTDLLPLRSQTIKTFCGISCRP